MVRQMLMIVCCVLTLGLLSPTDSAPQLAVIPETIEVDLTRSLDVNCTFNSQSQTSLTNLISLVVDKTDDNNDTTPIFQQLASINEFTPDQVKIITVINATVSGHISTIGMSYLSLQWVYPRAAVVGLYRCSAKGLDTSGHPVEEQQTKQVTASHPNTNQLIEMVKLQQIQMDNMMKVLAEIKLGQADVSTLKNDVNTLYNNVSTLNSDVNQLNKTVSDEMKDADKYQDILSATLTHFFIKSSDYQGRHYLLSKEEPDTNHEAQASCLLQGGYLVEINDANEHNFIKNFIRSSAPQSKTSVMIGATQTENPGTWVFSHSHQLMNYTDWPSGYPEGTANTCVFLTSDYGWSMQNYECSRSSKKYTFICEIPNL